MMNQNEAEIIFFLKRKKATFSIWEYNKHFFLFNLIKFGVWGHHFFLISSALLDSFFSDGLQDSHCARRKC